MRWAVGGAFGLPGLSYLEGSQSLPGGVAAYSPGLYGSGNPLEDFGFGTSGGAYEGSRAAGCSFGMNGGSGVVYWASGGIYGFF